MQLRRLRHFKNAMKGKVLKFLKWTVISILSIGMITFISIFIFFNYMFGQIDFDKNKWMAAKGKNEQTRLKMIDSLLKTYSFKDQTREQVEAVIGTPDDTSYFQEYNMVYHLGTERSLFAIDSEWLCIKLKENKVVDVQVKRD